MKNRISRKGIFYRIHIKFFFDCEGSLVELTLTSYRQPNFSRNSILRLKMALASTKYKIQIINIETHLSKIFTEI